MLSKFCFFKQLGRDKYVAYNSLLFEPIIINENEYKKLVNDDLSSFSEDDMNALYKKGILVQNAIADEKAVMELRRYVDDAVQEGIYLIYIIPSSTCNLACKYCFIGQLENQVVTISTDTIDKLISEFYKHLRNNNRKKASIIFYGGEPLMAFDKIQYTVRHCLTYSDIEWDFAVVTNLTLLTEEMVDFFVSFNIALGVSIDGPKTTNDANRVYKNGSNASVYNCVMNKLKLLTSKTQNVGLSITLTNETLDDPTFLDWIQSLNIKEINYNLMHYTAQNSEWEEYYKKVSAFLFKSHDVLSKHGIIDDRLQRKIRAFCSKDFKYNDCGAIGGHQLCFAPNGDVTVCHGLWNSNAQCCGNINNNTFEEIMTNDIFVQWKTNLTIHKEHCLQCPAIYICGGGCAMQSRDLFGDFSSIDNAFCIHTRYSLDRLLETLD